MKYYMHQQMKSSISNQQSKGHLPSTTGGQRWETLRFGGLMLSHNSIQVAHEHEEHPGKCSFNLVLIAVKAPKEIGQPVDMGHGHFFFIFVDISDISCSNRKSFWAHLFPTATSSFSKNSLHVPLEGSVLGNQNADENDKQTQNTNFHE